MDITSAMLDLHHRRTLEFLFHAPIIYEPVEMSYEENFSDSNYDSDDSMPDLVRIPGV